MGNETGVLLMAYGAAGSLDEVEPYLNDIRGGRPVSPSLVEDIKRRYSLMGGKSPLLDTTRQLASALETSLNRDLPPVTVYIGMRHWHPFIKDTVSQMAADGIQKIIAICLTPYHSKLSVGAYIDKLNEGIAASGKSFSVQTIESWNDHPALIEALAEKVGEALERFPAEIRPKVPLVFT
ncbi:MAG TPA: ferrochelatase, partial [Nitrospiria bacterium]